MRNKTKSGYTVMQFGSVSHNESSLHGREHLLLLLLYSLTAIGLSPGGRTQSHTNNT
jgi:hypothetical protein